MNSILPGDNMSKFSDIISNLEQKKLKSRISEALKTLRNGDVSQLIDKLHKTDKSKVNELLDEMQRPENSAKLDNLKRDLAQQVTKEDFDKLRQALNSNERELVDKVEQMITEK